MQAELKIKLQQDLSFRVDLDENSLPSWDCTFDLYQWPDGAQPLADSLTLTELKSLAGLQGSDYHETLLEMSAAQDGARQR